MRNYFYGLFALLLFGLMSFSEGKPCPGRTRPHKTRCDAYYKCTEINDQKHVWVPAKCEEGLIYEHSLGVCVLPADDWECGLNATADTNRNPPSRSSPSANKDADFYVVTNAREELEAGHRRNDKFDDGKVEIVIGTGVSSEEVEGGDALYDGSGNGGELVQLDDLINVENREANDVVMLKDKEEAGGEVIKPEMHEVLLDAEKKEELNEVLETIKTKAEIGQPSSNIDPKLTAHLQRLSQLVEGLKQTYQNSDTPSQDLRPDQLNAFLAHFNIKNKFENLEPHGEEEEKDEMVPVIVKGMNKTGGVKKDNIKKLNPETKVVLSNILPKRYQQLQHGGNDGGYSNSQIVVNRPEGAVLFALPQSQGEHHFVERPEYSSDNSPKISEDTLKTVLELSKQMIASQNIPSVIHNPAYYAPPIMQPIVLTQSPFSTDYYGARPPPALHHGGNGDDDDGNEGGYSSVFSSDHHYHGYKSHKKPPRKTSHDKSPATTIIHNNVIPLHLTSTGGSQGSLDKLDSYGQNLNLYPPLDSQEERPDNLVDGGYAGGNGKPVYENNKYGIRTTRRPSGTTTTQMPSYGHTIRPNDFHPTSHSFNKYFTPSEHLNNQNVNSIFQTTDNYGNLLPRPSSQQGQSQSSSYSETDNSNNYGTANQGYEQSMFSEDHLQQHQPQYPNSVDEEDTDMIQYTFGNPKPSHADGNLQMQQYSGSQSVFSSNNNINNHYMPRPSSSSPANNMMYNPSAISTNSYNPPSSSSNAYNPLLSLSSSSSSSSNAYNPLTALSYSGSSSGNKYPNKAGTQLVNIGGNFISIDAFQNSILPLMGGNAQAAPNVEVITCAAGVRQPNTTDCTRYYVCSKKDGKVLSYSCPPYTAFNADTRICDARTYALCNPDNEVPQTYSVNENKRLQMEALKAMQEAKRKQQQQQQQQMQQQQQLANILQQYTMQGAASASMNSNTNPMLNSYNSPTGSDEQNMLQSYMQQNSAASLMSGTTARPQLTPTKSKKRKYYCKEGDKIPDQTSISSYFVCYKNAQGQMKGHKMTCSKGLLFCPKTTMCTLPSKCS